MLALLHGEGFKISFASSITSDAVATLLNPPSQGGGLEILFIFLSIILLFSRLGD
ncbi:MAG: hypothetical protein K0S23_912 [Fluviicola sp.]|jgi:hypothetical protein|nr:hypothetical protein [Fluviicola sp.]